MTNVLTINVRDATGNTVSVSTNDSVMAALGEVQASPTANTLADRLKQIDGSLNAMPTAQGQTTKSGSLSVALASDDDVQAKLGILTETAPATDTASSGLNGRLQRIAQRLSTLITQTASGTPGTPSTTAVTSVQGVSGMTPVNIAGFKVVTCTTSFNRPANTTSYAAKQSIADSTTAPTAGGFTLTGAASAAGQSGIITDVVITSSNPAATPLQGNLYIFDTAITATNDAAALNISTTNVQTLVAIIPFTLTSTAAASHAMISNLNISFTTVGNANLRFCLQAINAYAPISGETFTVRVKCTQNN